MAKKAADTQESPNAASAEECRCGCGETVNAKRLFRQGHDQKLISKLLADVMTGSGTGLGILSAEEAKLDIQERISRVAAYVADKLSGPLSAKFGRAAMNAWANENKRQPHEPAESAKIAARLVAARQNRDREVAKQILDADPPVSDEGHTLGTKVQVKVGRYVYDGEVAGMNQAGKVTAVRYTNKAGKEHVLTAPKQIKLV